LHEKLHNLVHTFAVVQRRDQRLDNGRRPVKSACVAPAFQIMFFRDMPMAMLRGLIEVQTEVDTEWNFIHSLRAQFQVHGCRVNRIPTKNYKHFDSARIEVPNELTEL